MLLDLHVKQVTIKEAVYVAINTRILSYFDDYQYRLNTETVQF